MRPNISEWPAPIFSAKVRVYFEDTDAGGIVYHANYLRFMERARSDWLRSLGVMHGDLARAENIVLVVRDAKLEFLLPARLDEELIVDVRLLELRRASMVFAQTVLLARPESAKAASAIAGDADRLLATGTVRVAALSRHDGKVAAIPEWLMEKIKQ